MTLSTSYTRAASWLASMNYPTKDEIQPAVSAETFDDGSIFGVEIPAVNHFAELELMVKLIKQRGLSVTRFNETHGSFLLSDAELSDMLDLCREADHGLLISLGPRPEYDTKASFYRSAFGLEMGRSLNNMDAIRVCIDEALRLAELGCTGLIIYDLGVLQVLNEMRIAGALPKGMVFKTSSHCIVSNAFTARVFGANGADSVTTLHDLGLASLQQIRGLNSGLVIDVPTDVYKAKGGFIRFHELTEVVQLAAPVILKMGASAQNHPYDAVDERLVSRKIDRVGRGLEVLDSHMGKKKPLSSRSRHACLPSRSEQ